jgi:hypothetical protein
MAHSGLLLANNNACQNVIPTAVPPDLSATKASKIHSRNVLAESRRLGLLSIQQHLLLPSHIQSMGLGSRTSRPLLEHKPVAVIRCRRDRDSGCHHYYSPSSRNTSLTPNTEVEVRGNMHIHNRYLVSLKRRGIRIWKMYSFANSNNPTWDNVPGDHWTVCKSQNTNYV